MTTRLGADRGMATTRWRQPRWRSRAALVLGACGFAAIGGAAPEGRRSPIPSTFYVAKDGSDTPQNGSPQRPWATLTFAVEHVPDGGTVVVRPGSYQGRVSLGRRFVKGVLLRAEVPYRAMLRHNDKVVACRACEGITLEGFDIAHNGTGAGPLVVQVDGGGGVGARRVVIRNNVLHDSFRNDILKINNGARDIRVQGNVFYNQGKNDEHIDINSAQDVVVEDNIFFNAFEAASHSPRPEDTGSFVVVKDSNDDDDGLVGSRNVVIRRNVFLGWDGGRAYGFILLGEDGMSYYEASDVLIENNLLIGDSARHMRSPFGVKGCRRALFRYNTIIGDLPGGAFATRINREGNNRPGDELWFVGNVWVDPTGTMSRFSHSAPDDVGRFSLSRNLYWNGGAALPGTPDDVVKPSADRKRVVADPGLPLPHQLVPPRWIPERGAFADGSSTIEAARLRLVEIYARPTRATVLIDRGDPASSPRDDIRGQVRAGLPDLGAYEAGDAHVKSAAGRRTR